jgi:hypothetical protein
LVIELFAKEYPIQVVAQEFLVPVGYPYDIATGEEMLKRV